MILSSARLHAALDEGRLIIAPEPTPRIPTIATEHCPYDTHSVDLTLAPEISIPEAWAFRLRSDSGRVGGISFQELQEAQD